MKWFTTTDEDKNQSLILKLQLDIHELEAQKFKLKDELDSQKKILEREYSYKMEDLKHSFELKQKTLENETSNIKANLILKHEQEIAKLQSKFDKELIVEKERLNKDFYDRMTSSLSELHSKGNHTTDFLKEMTLKMLEKAPAQVSYDPHK